MTTLDPESAARVHYVDPRVRQLAEARWRLTTGGTEAEWLALGKDNPEALIEEGRDWLRAAVAVGIVAAPCSACHKPYDQTDPEQVAHHTEPVDCGQSCRCVGAPRCYFCTGSFCKCSAH